MQTGADRRDMASFSFWGDGRFGCLYVLEDERILVRNGMGGVLRGI